MVSQQENLCGFTQKPYALFHAAIREWFTQLDPDPVKPIKSGKGFLLSASGHLLHVNSKAHA